MQKYRFSNPVSVVEVSEYRGSYVSTKPTEKPFNCLCRGFGQNNHAPRKQYFVAATTPSQAARIAIDKYRKEFFEDGEENK